MATRVAMTAVHPARKIPLLGSSTVLRNYLNWRIPSLPIRSRRDGISPIDTTFFDAGALEMYYPFHKTAKLNIYRVNDLAGEYVSQVPSRIAAERDIIRKADLLFAVSQSIYDSVVEMRGTSSNVYYLPNGFDGTLFADTQPLPPEYEQIPAPRAVLVGGNFSEWYDWDLLLKAAKMLPDVSFCIIGRRGVPEELPVNMHFLGSKPHDRIPGYLQHAQVGLIPFQDMLRIRRVERPLKFYEYLATGLPIVSVPYGSMRAMAPHATFAVTPAEWAKAIAETVTITPQERAARMQSAEQFSWHAMMQEFEVMLAQEGIRLPKAGPAAAARDAQQS